MNNAVALMLLAICPVLIAACGSPPEDSGATLFLPGSGSSAAESPTLRDRMAARDGLAVPGIDESVGGGPASVQFGPANPGNMGRSAIGPFGPAAGPGADAGAPEWALPPEVESLARVAVAVESVAAASAQLQAIAERLGGFVDALASSGGSAAPQADITIKVPQVQIAPALEFIEFLGDVQYRSLRSEDVTERHIDLTARLSVYRKEEQNLLSLLERSSTVTELLSIEKELARVRTDIERSQGQLNLLEDRVAMAAIQVTLFPRDEKLAGPAAVFNVRVADVADRVAELQEYVSGQRGEIDEIYLASAGAAERAEVAFRVFPQNFQATARFIEDQGQVESRELLEHPTKPSGGAGSSRDPAASFEVSYVDHPAGVNLWTPLLIILGLTALGGGLAFLLRTAYRRGRQRGSFI